MESQRPFLKDCLKGQTSACYKWKDHRTGTIQTLEPDLDAVPYFLCALGQIL